MIDLNLVTMFILKQTTDIKDELKKDYPDWGNIRFKGTQITCWAELAMKYPATNRA